MLSVRLGATGQGVPSKPGPADTINARWRDRKNLLSSFLLRQKGADIQCGKVNAAVAFAAAPRGLPRIDGAVPLTLATMGLATEPVDCNTCRSSPKKFSLRHFGMVSVGCEV